MGGRSQEITMPDRLDTMAFTDDSMNSVRTIRRSINSGSAMEPPLVTLAQADNSNSESSVSSGDTVVYIVPGMQAVENMCSDHWNVYMQLLQAILLACACFWLMPTQS